MKTEKNLAVFAWKENNMSFSKVKDYAKTSKEPHLLKALEKINVKQSEITYEFIREGANPENFFTHSLDGKRTGDKLLFSLHSVLTWLKNAKELQLKNGINEHNEVVKMSAKQTTKKQTVKKQTVKKVA